LLICERECPRYAPLSSPLRDKPDIAHAFRQTTKNILHYLSFEMLMVLCRFPFAALPDIAQSYYGCDGIEFSA